MRFRLFACLFFCSLLGQRIYAQEQAASAKVPEPQKDFWDKFYVGGNFGLSFGTYSTVVDVSPQFGYKLTERLIAGVGVSYTYYRFKDPRFNETFSTNIYGGSLFSKYLITESLFAHVEFEALNVDVLEGTMTPPYYRIARAWIPIMFVGGGYRQAMGDRASLQFLLLYDIIQDRNSPYRQSNPIIRIGFGLGF